MKPPTFTCMVELHWEGFDPEQFKQDFVSRLEPLTNVCDLKIKWTPVNRKDSPQSRAV